ncbi:MAG: HNH endonuclease family protein [Rhodomicrobium sp.]
MKDYVPNDATFTTAFASARVGRPFLARYYLRALDKTLKNDPVPEYVANEDETEINLEHVMPLTPSSEWAIDADTGSTAQKLLGNMILLRAPSNSALGNKSFAEKKKVYAESAYAITQLVSDAKRWTLEEIKQRQAEMAKIAVKTWPA